MSNKGSVAPKERINIRYVTQTDGAQQEVELPLNMMVIGDFSARKNETPLEGRTPIRIDKNNFNNVLEGYAPNVVVNVTNRLTDQADLQLPVNLTFTHINDFSPQSIVNNVPELNALLALREALVALKGPLGNMPAFRKKISSLLQDTDARNKLLAELNIAHDNNAE